MNRFLFLLGQTVCGILFALLFRLEVRGKEHIPRRGAVLVAANHSSFLDPPLVGRAFFPRPLRYVARVSVFETPVIGWLVRHLGAVPLEHEGFAIAMRDILGLLGKGEAVLVFPEGTRSPDGRLQEAKAGIGFLAKKAGCPVIPVGIRGASRALPRGRGMIRPVRVTVTIGEPMRVSDGSYEEIAETVMERLRELLEE